MTEYKIKLRQSSMPSANQLVTYLKEIDENKIYSNRGPLLNKLESRLARNLKVDAKRVVVLSSGTIALELALRTIPKKKNSKNLCIMPAFTFPATVSAAISAGFTPYFLDVSGENYMLEPNDIINNHVDLNDISAVIPVSSFGSSLNIKGWDQFYEDTNINVVLDEAWSFDNFKVSKNNFSMISLHSTKVLGTGEGGLLILPERVDKSWLVELSNFGFNENRTNIKKFGTNAKMSEYSAAVGLASLDRWEEVKEKCLKIQNHIIEGIKAFDDINLFPGLKSDWVWMSFVIVADQEKLKRIKKKMKINNIESRSWWETLCSDYDAFKCYPKEQLIVSKKISQTHLNLPLHEHLSLEDIEKILTKIKES